ncbi:MAG: hypothetical protein ACYC0X_13955 [Pirellulaceae bacterium]
MWQRRCLLARMLCLAALLGSGCTTEVRPAPSRIEPARQVWDELAEEPVLAEDEP